MSLPKMIIYHGTPAIYCGVLQYMLNVSSKCFPNITVFYNIILKLPKFHSAESLEITLDTDNTCCSMDTTSMKLSSFFIVLQQYFSNFDLYSGPQSFLIILQIMMNDIQIQLTYFSIFGILLCPRNEVFC